jgi:hypothetical protein
MKDKNVLGGTRLGRGATLVLGVACVFAISATALAQESAGPMPGDAAAAAEPGQRTVRAPSGTALGVSETVMVHQLTGPGSVNETAMRWDVHGTDLGHMFWHRGQLYMVFGDTFGKGGLGGQNWRSNTLALLADPDPREGLRIESMIADPEGRARELIPSRKIDGVEKTVIPTYGISIDERMYLHYMSVSQWGGGSGQWDVRHSGFAYSDDDGYTWTVPETAIWPASTGFEQVALVRDEAYVYVLGIPGGRFGGIRLSRVVPDGLLDRRGYEYWNGDGWVPDVGEAATVVGPPAGELSVAWNALHERWMLMYLNLENDAVVLRTAQDLTGPWSEEQVVLRAEEYRGLYAPYIVPTPEIGEDVYFTLSLWKPYNVFLMHMKLQEQAEPGPRAGR